MPKSYELTAFVRARGNAEHIRYLFHKAGVPFKEIPVKWGSDEARAEWARKSKELPFGQVPVLKVDGKVLAQSSAIARFLANEFGLNGGTNFEKALCDQYVDGIMSDLYPKYQPTYVVILKGGTSEQSLTWADITLGEFMERFQSLYDAKVLDGHPSVAKLAKMVHEQPGIKEYVASRPAVVL